MGNGEWGMNGGRAVRPGYNDIVSSPCFPCLFHGRSKRRTYGLLPHPGIDAFSKGMAGSQCSVFIFMKRGPY